MQKVLLTTLNSKYIHLNLAIRILYDLNEEHHQHLHWHEFTIKTPTNEIVDYVKDYQLICFSVYIWNITPILKLSKIIKEKYPHIKILLGGPEVSYEWEQVIALPQIDYIISGEGEVPFTELMNHYPDVQKIPNLIHKDWGHVQFNKQSVQFEVKNFEGRNPYQYDDPASLKHRVCYIETSRGCPYKCSFCLASLDNSVRYLPMQTIKNNLRYLMQHGKVIKFLDRTFNIKKDFTIDLFQFILDHHTPGNVFQFEITADIIHPDIITFINEKVPKGLFRFEIGIQTVNQESNLAVQRKQNFDKTSSVIKAIEDKIEMHLDLIVGLPFETFDKLKYSFESVFKLYAPELQFGFLKFLKGTPVREQYEKYGYLFDETAPYQIIKSDFLSEQELMKMTLLEHALEVYWNKKRALNTLKYITQHYSIFDFLMSLGELFNQNHILHLHSLKDIYLTLMELAQRDFAEDTIVQELIILDYFTYAKVKPQDIYNIEIDRKTTNQLINQWQLNHHQYRHFIHPTSFNVDEWTKNNLIVPTSDYIIIQYDGVNQGKLLSTTKLFHNKYA